MRLRVLVAWTASWLVASVCLANLGCSSTRNKQTPTPTLSATRSATPVVSFTASQTTGGSSPSPTLTVSATATSAATFTATATGTATPTVLSWEAGVFRYLPSMTGDLVTFVSGLPHPNSGGYLPLDATRTTNFNAFLSAMFTALSQTLADGATGDWCGVQTAAAAAGYALARYYDTTSGRWFLYGYDTTTAGQAYFFVNLYAKRNIVVECPHTGFETYTDLEGTQIFLALACRALLINGEHRCSAAATAACGGTTTVCGGFYRQSDVCHDPSNTFHLLHKGYSNLDAVTKFVQLHGMTGGAYDYAEVGDGTTNDYDPSSVSVTFASNLMGYVPTPTAVLACQGYVGNPPSDLCATDNIQGRYTNNPSGNECTTGTTTSSGRFVHVEQILALRGSTPTAGWYWGEVRDALRDTWPACNLSNGATDCSLGPAQTPYPNCACGTPCP